MAPRHRNRAQAWAIVTPRGKIQVDTVRERRSDVLMMMTEHDEATGCKIRRVEVRVDISELI